MPKREDETLINVLYNGHPPTCICAECSKMRLAYKSQYLNDSNWIPELRECPYCHRLSTIRNIENTKLGCMNIHCRKYYEYL